MPSAEPPLRVGLLTYRVVGLIMLGLCLFGFVQAVAARQVGLALLALGSSPLWLWLAFGVRAYELDATGIYADTPFGRSGLRWADMTRVEYGAQGTLVFRADGGRRFVVAPVGFWNGRDVRAAADLMQAKLLLHQLQPQPNKWADCLWSSHCRVGA